MCCEDWSHVTNESDFQKYWQYADSQAINCDWFCEDCPEARNHEEKEANGKPEDEMNCPIACIGEVPLIVILMFIPFICGPPCCFWCFYRLWSSTTSSTSAVEPQPSSTSSTTESSWSPPRPPTPQLSKHNIPPTHPTNQPAMPPPPPQPPMTGATMQSYQDLPPPPAYESHNHIVIINNF